jgi:hypothetical protein
MNTTVRKMKAEVDPDTGWYVTEQEAYLPEEWDEHKHTCDGCGDEFVLYTSDDSEPPRGRNGSYCGSECLQEAHRKASREWARRHRAAAKAVA